ncbi:MAG: hypothetical protein HKN73_12520 [Gemmatimonadetes bacterium]|nr:hypothetical protein [Gemmatimonadota bacterium]
MHHFDLAFLGQTLSVATTVPDCGDVLRALFRPYLVPETHSTAPDVVVVAAPEGAVIEWAGGAVSVALEDLAPELEHVVTQAILESLPDLLHLHGAAVVGGAGAALALGASGAGKSSIATCWTVSGRPVLGDDVVFLDRKATLHPLMKPLKVDAERVRAFGLPLEDTVRWEPEASEAWVDPEAHGGWALAAPVVGLVILERVSPSEAPEDRPELVGLPGPEGAQAVLGQCMTTGGRPAGWIDPILELVEGVGVHRLRFSDSRHAAELLAAVADRPLNG